MTERTEIDRTAGERTMLTQMLDYYRETLMLKVAGLTDEQARTASVPPSDLNLLGLIRHAADVERSWFRVRFAGEDLEPLFYRDEVDPDGDLHPGPTDTLADGLAALVAEIDAAHRITDAASLDDVATVYSTERGPFTLRWVLVHLIEEYARHVGHADLLRERIDGVTGD